MQNLFSIFTIIFCISTFGIGAMGECGVDQTCLGEKKPALFGKPKTEAVKEANDGGKPDKVELESEVKRIANTPPSKGQDYSLGKDTKFGGNSSTNESTPVQSKRSLKEATVSDFKPQSNYQAGAYEEFKNQKQYCQRDWETALNQCNENRADEQMSKFSMASGVVDATAPIAMGMMDSCSTLAKTLKGAQAILAGFRANCAIQKDACNSECGKASKIYRDLKTDWAKYKAQPPQNLDPSVIENNDKWLQEEASSSTESTWASHAKDCEGQQKVLEAASRNIMTFAVGQIQSQNCEKELASTKTDVCDQYPNMAGCAAEVKLDCTIAENKKKRECICEANARDPICKTLPSVASKLNGGLDQGVSEQASLDPKKAGLNSVGNPLDFGGSEGLPPGGGGGAASSGGSGSGSGLAGGGGSGGSQSGDSGQGQGGSPRSKVDTNVGFASGSGGGYSGAGYQRGSYSGYNRRKPSNYGAYLPGGELDPSKNKAGNDGMTGSHGPTLFDKVGGRYRDNRGTLISD